MSGINWSNHQVQTDDRVKSLKTYKDFLDISLNKKGDIIKEITRKIRVLLYIQDKNRDNRIQSINNCHSTAIFLANLCKKNIGVKYDEARGKVQYTGGGFSTIYNDKKSYSSFKEISQFRESDWIEHSDSPSGIKSDVAICVIGLRRKDSIRQEHSFIAFKQEEDEGLLCFHQFGWGGDYCFGLMHEIINWYIGKEPQDEKFIFTKDL